MASWKKIITSGSDGELNSLFVDNGITGSLFGTASFADNVKTLESIFSTTNVGAIEAGFTLDEGTSFTDFVRTLLQKTFEPTFTNPSATTNNINTTVEVGTNFSTTLTVTFDPGQILGTLNPDGTWNSTGTQNPRAGNPISFTIDGETQPGNSRTVSRIIQQGGNPFTSSVLYSEGPTPLNSINEPSGAPLPQGSVNATTRTVTGRFIQFFGPTSSTPTTSQNVRDLPQEVYDNVNTLLLNTGTTSNKFAVAIPSSKSINNVIDLGNLNADITSQYQLIDSTFQVVDGDGNGTPRDYKLYVMTAGIPYANSTTHQISLS